MSDKGVVKPMCLCRVYVMLTVRGRENIWDKMWKYVFFMSWVKWWFMILNFLEIWLMNHESGVVYSNPASCKCSNFTEVRFDFKAWLRFDLNLYVTPELFQKFITNLHLSKTSGLDIPVLVLKKCEPGFSYILAELFNISLKEPYFGDCWKVSSVVTVFRNIGERGLMHKTTVLLVFFLWLVKSS